MASYNISDSLSDEQIIALLQMLFTNMNNLDKLYYDMFINTTPLTLTLERYNDDGVIESYQLPNRAKDKMNALQGRGEPEGSQTAGAGTFYIDSLTSNVWVKTLDTGAVGWVMLYTPSNFVAGRSYLAPDGDASSLTGISASSLTGGIMSVSVGGTGTQGLTGIIKGRGKDSTYTVAEPNVDYIEPQTIIGSLGLFMRDVAADTAKNIPALPDGWLPCNGAVVSKLNYPTLYQLLQNTYPNNTITTTSEGTLQYTDYYGNVVSLAEDSFVLPDFQDMYIRGWDGTSVIGRYQAGAVPNVQGEFFNSQESETALNKDPSGAFTRVATSGDGVDGSKGWFERIHFSAADYKPTKDGVEQESVYKDDVYEVRVNNLSTVVCIYAGKELEDYEY